MYFLSVIINQKSNQLAGLTFRLGMSRHILRQICFESLCISASGGDAGQFGEFVPVKLFQL